MLKMSSFLKEAAENVAKEMLENGATESNIPTAPTYFISRNAGTPDHYMKIGNVEVEGKKFHVFQII